jgi:hypothetical protein
MASMTKKLGRPTKYNEKISKLICDRISKGESLASICKDEGFPDRGIVFDWQRIHPDFHHRMSIARENQVMGLADELMDLARDGSIDTQRAKLQIDTVKWLLAKLLPRAYGDKVPAPEPSKLLSDQSKPSEQDVGNELLKDSLAAWDAASKGEVPAQSRRHDDDLPPNVRKRPKEETMADVLDRFRGKGTRRDD